MQSLSRMQMMVMQFCETAQMVEYNSHGLVQFLQLIKKFYIYIITTGKDLIISFFQKTKEIIYSLYK